MQFSEIVLHNVGAYLGRQIIDLTTSPEKPVILIGGLNGCGKTTLLDSIQLVLYGNRARCAGRENQSYDDYLRSSISWNAAPEEGAAIRLTFEVDEDGQHRNYEITRSWTATRSRVKEVVDVRIDGRRDSAVSDGWSDFVEELLPLEIASLFFFDGEKIAALADPETAGAVVRTAVQSLLGISTLQQLRTDLVALQRRQVVDGVDPRIEQRIADLTQESARVQMELDLLSQKRGEVVVRRHQAEGALAAAESDFHRQGGGLFERRVELETELKAVKAEIDRHRVDLRGLAEGALPLALVSSHLRDVEAQARQEGEAVQTGVALGILESRDRWLLQQIDQASRSRVAGLMSADREERQAIAEVPQVLGLDSEAQALLVSLKHTLGEQSGSVAGLLGSLNKLVVQAETIERQLAAVPDKDAIAGLVESVNGCRTKVAQLRGAEGALNEDHERLTALKEGSELALSAAHGERLNAALGEQDVRRIVDHAERVRATLAELEQRLLLRHIGRVEVATLESFRRLMRKEGLVQDLQIDPETFSVSLLGADGQQIDPGRLSAGERQLLAIALLWGIARVAGDRIPTIVDTPLGRLDSHHRRYLVDRYFPKVGNQVLLLSTDEEFDEELASRLAPAVARTFLLNHDDDAKVTTVEEGYWWPLGGSDVA